MKKFLSLMLALMLALFSVSALAEATTVTVRLTADPEVVQNAAAALQAPPDSTGTVNAAIALINALGFQVVADGNAAQLNISANEQPVIALGGKVTDDGLIIASDLFPSFLFSISKETIEQAMNQMVQNMPGSNVDMQALLGKITIYAGEFMGKMQTAITSGEPEAVEFEVNGIAFDTKTPQNVDVKAIAEAEKKLVSDILHDETVIEMIKSINKDFNPEEVIQQNDASMADENLPKLDVNVYTNSAKPGVFFVECDAAYNNEEEPSYRFTLLNGADGTGIATFYVLKEGITVTATAEQSGFAFEVEGNGAYFAIKATVAQEGSNVDIATGIYFMDKERALLKIDISVAEGGEITLPMDGEGQQVLKVEELQNNQADNQVAQAFLQEIQSKAIPLVTTILSAVPEAAPLLQLMNR